MPFQHKSNRYQKRSHSSSSQHQHRRDRRNYEKDKTERFQKYHRRSRSKTPTKEDNYKGKYSYHYQHKEERRYYDHYRDGEKSKVYDHGSNKREQFEKRDKEKGDQYAYKPKHNRYEDKESSRVRERQSGYQKRERTRNSPEHDRKRRKSSSSHSVSSSRKQAKRTEPKPSSYSKYSSNDRYRQHERRNKRSMEKQEESNRTRKIEEDKVKVSPQKQYKSEVVKPVHRDFPPPPPKPFDRNSPTMIKRADSQRQQKAINKPLFKLKSIPPPPPSKPYRQEQMQRQTPRRMQRYPQVIQPKPVKQEPILPIKRVQTQPKQPKPQSPLIKQKLSKFDQLLTEARHNLTISPPNSTFLMLETFRTMNKFQVQTLDPKWMNFLKKDMERYQEEKEAVMSKLAEPSQDQYELTGQQYIWMKEERNEQELELKFRFEEFKQHNSNLNQMIRRLRFLD